MAYGDLQAAGFDAFNKAIDLEVDAYFVRRVIPKLKETTRATLIETVRKERDIEPYLAEAEFNATTAVQDYDRTYQAALDGFRDLFRQGLDEAKIDFHISMP